MKVNDQAKFFLSLSVVLLLIMGLLAAGNYFLLDRSGRGQSLARWHNQVEERARLLAEPFAQAERRLEQARDDVLARMDGQKVEDSVVRYDQEFEVRADMTTRPKAATFDAGGDTGVFLPPGVTPDDALKHLVIVMHDTANLFGQSWLKEFPNLWFAGPERWMVAYFPEYPWTEKLEPAFDATAEVWYSMALPERNAKLKAVWGNARPDIAGKSLVATLSMPVMLKDKPIAVIGQDVPLKRLIDSIAAGDNDTGIIRLVVDARDGIVAMSDAMPEILKAGAPLRADKKIPELAAAIEAVRTHGENTGTILDNAGKRAIVYARVTGQPWTLVTVVPNAQLVGQTTSSALMFAGGALLGGVLMIVVLLVLLKGKLSGPQEKLARLESELKAGAEREAAAVQITEDLTRQLEEARKKSSELEARVSAANAALAKAEAAAAAAAAAATADFSEAMAEAETPAPAEDEIAALDVNFNA
jgi:hypothetical protein